jgi:peptide deformylase
MSLSLVMAPHPVFKMKAKEVAVVDDEIRTLMDQLLEVMYAGKGVGIAAPMVGVLKSVIALDLKEGGVSQPIFMANPQLLDFSIEKQTFTEGSLCFPGISAAVSRPKNIEVEYLDYKGELQRMNASGFLSTCIQHEMDYLRGVIFLDYLPSTKRHLLIRRMIKLQKQKVR